MRVAEQRGCLRSGGACSSGGSAGSAALRCRASAADGSVSGARACMAPAVAAALAHANAMDVALHAEAAALFDLRKAELARLGRLAQLPLE